MARQAVIGVMGGGSAGPEVCSQAEELGALIAGRGWVLLNGGRNAGVMAASARGARRAGGVVLGILPDHDATAASPDLDYAVITGLGDARNLINVLSSDVVIACPGGAGTLSEVALALKNRKPVILLGRPVDDILAACDAGSLLRSARDPADAVAQAADLLARRA